MADERHIKCGCDFETINHGGDKRKAQYDAQAEQDKKLGQEAQNDNQK